MLEESGPSFQEFASAAEWRFGELATKELFKVDAGDLWAKYLAAFPAGTDPIFRERTVHDCNCCKQFVRRLGNVVAIVDGRVLTVWDLMGLPGYYQEVAETLGAIVRAAPIIGVFRTKEEGFGKEKTFELVDDHSTHEWRHFHGAVRDRHRSEACGSEISRRGSAHQVLSRGLKELKESALQDVLDLIDDNALYRGQEFRLAVATFQSIKRDFPVSARAQEIFIWARADKPEALFRNTVIGTLVQDLSEGMLVERAVASFESKVAPQNYKRPTAVITSRMVLKAAEKLEELGLTGATQRRFAKISDVSVNDVLFVDNRVRGEMEGGAIAELLMPEVVARQPLVDEGRDILAEQFFQEVLPGATSMQLLLEHKHLPNFVSLTAPKLPDVGQLFKWGNNFAWAYDGDVTDSVKQRVKAAGGNIEADLRVSLAWHNGDDLDIHCMPPDGRAISFRDKRGVLDVDMNAGGELSRSAVENLAWDSPADGLHSISVHNYYEREWIDVGFELEVECGGELRTFSHSAAVTHGVTVSCLQIEMWAGKIVNIRVACPALVEGSASQEKWGVATKQLVPIISVMRSPNHWGGQAIGNKHHIFMLEGCKNPGSCRGFFNEYLSPALEPHRKVFEVLGAKTMCEPSDEQLSGVGFSSTRHDVATIIVRGERSGTFNVHF